MGIKLLIKEACLIQVAGATTAQPAEVGETVEVDTKDEALSLCRLGRAYFVDKANDPTKGLLTATAEEVASVKKLAKSIAAGREEREAERAMLSPAGQAAFLAAEVAKAVAAALNKPVTA